MGDQSALVRQWIYGRKSYRLDPAWGNPDFAFTFDEALALYLGRKFLQPLDSTLVGEAAERALAKIRASLGSQVLQYLDHVGDAFYETSFGVTDYSSHAEILDLLLVGIEDRRVVRITYQSQRATEPVTYDVHPYRLARHQGSLYLIGLKAREAEVRTWHPSQQITDHRDGSLPIAGPLDLNCPSMKPTNSPSNCRPARSVHVRTSAACATPVTMTRPSNIHPISTVRETSERNGASHRLRIAQYTGG